MSRLLAEFVVLLAVFVVLLAESALLFAVFVVLLVESTLLLAVVTSLSHFQSFSPLA
ncbi:hypothetical protein [Bacillus marasmi]|uniref:hypothetical protein n=1 Tax=Bacillus marasmi TaxID=1926279 RepID=UPI00164E9929|nr:hypothetical protein [Bacillus marasmi]